MNAASRNERRRQLIVEMYNAGEPTRVIAEAVGWKHTSLYVEINRMRRAGYDLPYRYDEDRREAARAGFLAAVGRDMPPSDALSEGIGRQEADRG